MAYVNNAVYWVGADGNVYLKDASGSVQNVGNATTDNVNLTDGGFESNKLQKSVGATYIPDPNAPKTPAPAPTTTAAKTLNQGAVSNTQATIDQIPGLLQAALQAEATNHQNSQNTFDAQQQQEQQQHDTGTVTNQKNYDSTFMDSIRAGIHGLGGLMALLRGTGASGGTADQQAREAVGATTSSDIRGGADTRDENQGQLDSGLSSFLTDLKGKRQANEDTFTNNNRAIQRDSNTQLQDLYSKMAGYYGDAGNTGAANDWMSKAGALTPEIAQDSKTQVSPYDTSPIIVHAPNLTAFAPPTQPSELAAPSDGQVGTGIFTMNNTKRKDPTATLAPAGA